MEKLIFIASLLAKTPAKPKPQAKPQAQSAGLAESLGKYDLDQNKLINVTEAMAIQQAYKNNPQDPMLKKYDTDKNADLSDAEITKISPPKPMLLNQNPRSLRLKNQKRQKEANHSLPLVHASSPGDRLGREHCYKGKVPVATHVIKPVADHKLIANPEAGVVSLNLLHTRAVLRQQHAGVHCLGAFLTQPLCHRMQGATGVENVIQQQDVTSPNLRERAIQEIHPAGALGAAVVTRDIQALDLQRPRHPSE